MGDQGGGCSHLHAQSTLDAHKPQGRRQFLCTCHHPNTCARALLAEHRTPPATTRMQWCGAAPTNCGEPLGGSSCLYHVSWCRNGYLPRTGSRIWALRGPHGRPSPELRKRFQTRTAPCSQVGLAWGRTGGGPNAKVCAKGKGKAQSIYYTALSL